jgi:hypothetical protein
MAITETNQLILRWETVIVYCENHMNHNYSKPLANLDRNIKNSVHT